VERVHDFLLDPASFGDFVSLGSRPFPNRPVLVRVDRAGVRPATAARRSGRAGCQAAAVLDERGELGAELLGVLGRETT
jgi:hypothetical protein